MTVYRDQVEALAARHAALAGEVAARQRELDEAARLLADARARARLPIVDDLRIASPCNADWSAMPGDERVRHCAACDQDVFDLSAMTREEAQALFAARTGAPCVRFFQRADGTVLLADCTIGARRRRRRRRRLALVGAAALVAAATVSPGALAPAGGQADGGPRARATMGLAPGVLREQLAERDRAAARIYDRGHDAHPAGGPDRSDVPGVRRGRR